MRAALLQARGCWVVPKDALGSLGIEPSQGSGVRSAPISQHLSPSPPLNSPSPSGKWEDSLLAGRRGRGGAQRAGLRKAPGTREPASPRSGRGRCEDPPSRGAARPARRPQGPPRLHAAVRGSVARAAPAAGGREQGAEGRAAGSREDGARGGPGRTRPAGRRALPLPRGPEREPP